MMKKILLPTLASLFIILSGCTSTGFMGFLATTEMLDEKVSERDVKTTEEIARIREELRAVQDVKEQAQQAEDEAAKAMEQAQAAATEAQQAAAEVRATRQEIEELKILVDLAEKRIIDMPRETLMQLEQILRDFLEADSGSADESQLQAQ